MIIDFNDENTKLTLPWTALLYVKDIPALKEHDLSKLDLQITVNGLSIDDQKFFDELQKLFDNRGEEIKAEAKILIQEKLNDINSLLYNLESTINQKLNEAGINTEGK